VPLPRVSSLTASRVPLPRVSSLTASRVPLPRVSSLTASRATASCAGPLAIRGPAPPLLLPPCFYWPLVLGRRCHAVLHRLAELRALPCSPLRSLQHSQRLQAGAGRQAGARRALASAVEHHVPASQVCHHAGWAAKPLSIQSHLPLCQACRSVNSRVSKALDSGAMLPWPLSASAVPQAELPVLNAAMTK
jgi:hypothetical protein